MMRKIIKITSFTLLMLIGLLFVVTGSINVYRVTTKNNDSFDYLSNNANKVILFIGDGMGQNQINNAEIYLEKDLFFTTFEKIGYVNTYSKNTYWPTDSAAAATAIATGKKVYNTHIGSSFGEAYISISEIAKSSNMGVGIVTTDTLAGATPASFSAHAKKRSNTEEIIISQLENSIDLYLGAGSELYINYKEKFEDKGYTYISNYNELKQTSSKIIGSFPSVNNFTTDGTSPTLPLLTNYAIEYFETNYPNGYFLMIEGAHIDKSNHSNDIIAMINYLSEFDTSIKLAYDKIGNYEDVCFIVTADHESGKLDLANSKKEINNDLYKSSKHTHRQVFYLIYQKNNKEINKIPNIIDNTDIFKIIRRLLNI